MLERLHLGADAQVSAAAGGATLLSAVAPAAAAPAWWRPRATHGLLLSRSASGAQVLHPDAFSHWCARHRGQTCQLWLAADLVHDIAVDAALAIGYDRALLDYARPLLVHYHGDAALGWPLAAWHGGAALRGVSALHGLDLAALQAAAQANKVRLCGLRPWWSAALAQPVLLRTLAAALPQQLLVVQGHHVHHSVWQHGQLLRLQQRRLVAPSWAALAGWWRDSASADSEADAGTPAAAAAVVGYGLTDAPAAGVSDQGLLVLSALHQGAPAAGWLPARRPPGSRVVAMAVAMVRAASLRRGL